MKKIRSTWVANILERLIVEWWFSLKLFYDLFALKCRISCSNNDFLYSCNYVTFFRDGSAFLLFLLKIVQKSFLAVLSEKEVSGSESPIQSDRSQNTSWGFFQQQQQCISPVCSMHYSQVCTARPPLTPHVDFTAAIVAPVYCLPQCKTIQTKTSLASTLDGTAVTDTYKTYNDKLYRIKLLFFCR